MSRLNEKLQALAEQNKKALVTYLVAGDPSVEATVPTMHKMVEAGADVIELGVPFSDPMAEGPVIQLGHERALANGVSLRKTLAMAKEFRQQDQSTPVVLMGYSNPVERMGYKTFAAACDDAGVDGLLAVDLPPEEASDLDTELQKVGINSVYLIAPTTTEERMERVCAKASGFIYYVSLKGVTGAGHLDLDSVKEKVAQLGKYTPLPILVGFGIKGGETAKQIASTASGAVVGSVLVNTMGSMAGENAETIADAVATQVAEMRVAIDTL